MLGLGMRPGCILGFALAVAYGERGTDAFIRSRWRNIAYCVRYGKGVGLEECLALDMRAIAGLAEAISYCIEQESKASKSKRR